MRKLYKRNLVIENIYYTEEVQGPFECFELGNFPLEMGGTLLDSWLAYKTFGRLNSAKNNAVLFLPMYSGTFKDLEIYIGTGLALDPGKYFIIVPNQIGGGLSSSPHNTPLPRGMSQFPQVTIGDDVRAQYKLITQHFGIQKLELVLGWSSGAMQTFEWAVGYPDMLKRAAPLAGMAKTSPHAVLIAETAMEAIRSDLAWKNGEYRDPHAVHLGLRRHARIWSTWGVSSQFYHYREEAWRRLGFNSVDDFVNGVFETWFHLMDPNDLLCCLHKWKTADVSRHMGGDLAGALANVQAKVFNIPLAEDLIFSLQDCAYEHSLISESELMPISSLWGHFAVLGLFPEDLEIINSQIQQVLKYPWESPM